jgi:DNA-binding transcriptional LysR family regulator
VNLAALDLNLLKVFQAVMREGSVTGAAATLGLTQAAASNALGRLRSQLKDPLFVRTSQGMQPTAYAYALAGPVSDALSLLTGAIERNATFDAATSTRSFNVLMTDIGELVFLPRLIKHLQQKAPGIALVVHQLPRDQYRTALESGMADLALGQLPETHQDFHQQPIFEDSLLCMVRKGHPRIAEQLPLQAFMTEAQLAIVQPAVVERLVTKLLGKRADERRIVLKVPHYAVVPIVLAESDLIAVIPRTVATVFSKFDAVKAIALPFSVPTFQVRQFWHKRSHLDPAHAWLRAEIARLFRPQR